jgi:hypothetical protein
LDPKLKVGVCTRSSADFGWLICRHFPGGQSTVKWWRQFERKRGAGMKANGHFQEWFHGTPSVTCPVPIAAILRIVPQLPMHAGIISRPEAEQLLAPMPIGCFLTRVSENRSAPRIAVLPFFRLFKMWAACPPEQARVHALGPHLRPVPPFCG